MPSPTLKKDATADIDIAEMHPLISIANDMRKHILDITASFETYTESLRASKTNATKQCKSAAIRDMVGLLTNDYTEKGRNIQKILLNLYEDKPVDALPSDGMQELILAKLVKIHASACALTQLGHDVAELLELNVMADILVQDNSEKGKNIRNILVNMYKKRDISAIPPEDMQELQSEDLVVKTEGGATNYVLTPLGSGVAKLLELHSGRR